MIVKMWVGLGEKEDRVEFQTEGCSCCSSKLDVSEVEEVKKNLRENVEMVKKVCNVMGWDTKEFLT